MENTTKKDSPLYYSVEDSEIREGNTRAEAVFDLLNQRWTLLVLRHLASGRHRFNELVKLSTINPNTLRDRLREFEKLRIVDRNVVSAMPPNVEYELTPLGQQLCQIFSELDQWLSAHAVVVSSEELARREG